MKFKAMRNHAAPPARNPYFFRMLRLISDMISVSLSALSSFFVLSFVAGVSGINFVTFGQLLQDRMLGFLLTMVFVAIHFYYKGHYNKRIPFWAETKGVVLTCFMAFLIEGFAVFAAKADVSRLSIFLCWSLAPVFIMWGRLTVRKFNRAGNNTRMRSVIFGTNDCAQRAVDLLLADPNLEIDVVQVSDNFELSKCEETIAFVSASAIFIALSGCNPAEAKLAMELRKKGYYVGIITPAMGMSARMELNYFIGRDAMLLTAGSEVAPNFNRVAKRIFDIMIASAALSILFIPMFIISLIITLDGSSPFFSHQRVGRYGKKFGCYKFRSMQPDSDIRLEEYLASNESARKEWEETHKLAQDPRVTKIGKFIRKTSIDELPQLINVLKGDMSLIGPRPVTERELDHYGDARIHYMAVRPGVTGLWQVSGRSDLSYERRVELDTWYVENWSPWHDIAILAKTFPVVLGRSGAY